MIRASSAALLAALFLACGTSSPAPSKCATSQSVCLPPTGAASFCADLTSDAKNCGACNLACPAVTGSTSVACHAGECVADCGGGFSSTSKVVCGGKATADGGITAYCTDTTTDHENCGGCGTVCNGAQQCQAGKCTAVAGTAACGGSGTGTTYANLQTDRANCGACGNACAAAETCSDGACNPCPVAQCGNICVDTQHDPNNCGTCGNVVANCENGVALAKLTIERSGVPFNPAVVGAPGNFSVSVKVHSQLRVARVTASVLGTLTDLSLASAAEDNPTVWSGTINIPSATTVDITFEAFDELYVERAADAGFVTSPHRDEQIATAMILPLPGAAAMPAAPTVQTAGTPSFQVGPIYKWVPLNGPALQFAVQVPALQNILTVDLRENNRTFGTVPVNAAGQAVFTALPAQVGLGDLSITACPFDGAGQQGPCSAATTFTVGRIAPLSAPAVISKNTDSSGNHSIFYVASTQQLFQQGGSDLNQNGSDQPGTLVGTALYYPDTMRPAPEGTGVYAVKTDGSGADRIDGQPPVIKTNFAAPPASVAFRGIDLVTPVALLLCDTAAAPNAGSYFATASAAQTTVAAVAAGILVGAGNANRGNLPCPATLTDAGLFNGRTLVQTTQSGAMVGWFNNGGDVRPQLFHPALPGNHLAPLLAAAPAGTVAEDLQVFPGGEIVFQFHDAAGTTFLGAALFDGINPPTLVPPVQTGPVGGQALGNSFMVPKPGVVLGAVPSPIAGSVQAIEIQPKGAGQVSFPAPPNGTTAGTLIATVGTRTSSTGYFAVSDDRTKVLFFTADPMAGAPDVVRRGHLLDLATGAAIALGESPNSSFSHQPHFVNSAPPFTGGAPVGSHQYVTWAETLPSAGGQITSHERIYFANFQGAISSIDRLNSFSAVDAHVESAAGGVVLFLSQTDQGGADLYAAPLASPAGTVTATRVMDHVFWFKVREDKARLLVARSDGTIYLAPLVPGANLSQTLVPLVNAGFLGDAPILNGDGINSFGFTPDGDHGYVLRDAYTGTINGVETATGIVETIDFTTGAFARTDFGRVIAGNVGGSTQPIIGFVGGATTAVVLDQLSIEANKARLAIAPPNATTGRVDTHALPSGYQFSSDSAVFFSSVDNNEGLMLYQGGFARGATQPFAFLRNGALVRLQKDGSFDVIANGSNSGLQQPATFSPFGGPYLPDWSFLNSFDSNAHSDFKVWGGASPAKFIRVSQNFTAQESVGTVTTPDLKELLFSFNNGDQTNGYVMALPLPGHTPPVPPVP
jgi:hypothetical protein